MLEKVYRFFHDLTERITGMNTRAPEIRMETISGPSIRAAVVSTRAQMLAHSKVRTTHWERESGFFIGWYVKSRDSKCGLSVVCFESLWLLVTLC